MVSAACRVQVGGLFSLRCSALLELHVRFNKILFHFEIVASRCCLVHNLIHYYFMI